VYLCVSSASLSSGKERDPETGLDYFGARYYGSNMGRFMSPDPMGGHVEDPQTLNRYVYVRNNPLSLTDPTGLDFYIQCTQSKDNASTCQQQQVGTDAKGNKQMAWVQGTTGEDGKFTATQIGNDKDGNLVDKTAGTGAYTATVNGDGVHFSNNGGKTTSDGVFVNGTANTTIQGGGNLAGFTFTFTNSKLEANQTAAGFFSFSGTPDQAGNALKSAGLYPMGIFGANKGYNEYRTRGHCVFL
jgi:RHS repeat-associated protein